MMVTWFLGVADPCRPQSRNTAVHTHRMKILLRSSGLRRLFLVPSGRSTVGEKLCHCDEGIILG